MSPLVLQRWLLVHLTLWGVGCMSSEALSTVGLAGCALGAGLLAVRGGVSVKGALLGWAPLVAFVAWALVVPLLAGRPPSGTGVARLGDLVGIPVAAVAVAHLTPERRRVVVAWVAGVFLFSCGLAAFQHYGVWPEPEFFDRLAWSRLSFYRVYELVPGREDRFMGGGLVAHRLKFAHVGALVVTLLVGLGLGARGRQRIVLLGLAAVFSLSILLFPYTRAASVCLMAAVGAMVLLGLPRRVALLACVVLVGLAGATFTLHKSLRERFLTSNTEEGTGGRRALLETGLIAVRESPVAGVGLGRFKAMRYATADMPDQVREHPGKAHNQYLSVAAEVGIPGAILFCVLLAWIARRLPVQRPEGLGALGGLVFFALLSLAHDPLFHVQFSHALALLLGAGLFRTTALAGSSSVDTAAK